MKKVFLNEHQVARGESQSGQIRKRARLQSRRKASKINAGITGCGETWDVGRRRFQPPQNLARPFSKIIGRDKIAPNASNRMIAQVERNVRIAGHSPV